MSEADGAGVADVAAQRGRMLRAGAALLALVLYDLCFYAAILSPERTYTFRDMYPFFHGLDHLARELARFHWPPLWNPFDGLGRPFLADPEAGLFYPPNWLLRLWPAPLAVNASIALHHLIAALGAFLLMRIHGLSETGALAGGLVFGFGGTLVSLDNVMNGLQSAAWLPWIALAFERWWQRRSSRPLMGLALAISFSILGAMPELVLVANALLLALVAARSRSMGEAAAAIAALAAANLLAVGLCGVMVVPFLESLSDSTRRAGLDPSEVLKHSLSGWGPLRFVLPRRFIVADGVLHTGAGRWETSLARAPWLLSLYIGAGILLAPVATRVLSPSRRRWWIAVLACFLVLSMGDALPGVRWAVERVRLLRLVRYPEKLLVAVHALLAAAIALGFDRLARNPARGRPAAASGALLAGGFFVAAIAAMNTSPAVASQVFVADLVTQGVLFLLAAAMLLGGARLHLAVVLLLAFDLWRVNGGLLPTMPWSEIVKPPAALSAMHDGELLRIFADGSGRAPIARLHERTLQEKNMLLLQAPGFFGVSNLNTPSPVNLADRDRLADLIRRCPPDRLTSLLGRFAVRYLTSPQRLTYPDLELVRSGDGVLEPHVFQVNKSLPRAFVASRVVAARTTEEVTAHLYGGAEQMDTVTVAAGTLTGPLPEQCAGEVSIESYRSDRVELRARMATAGLVVVNDAYYPGWEGYIDDRIAPVVRANHFVRGVAVEPGVHRVVFKYRPRSYRAGIWVSMVAGAVVLAAAITNVRLRRPGEK